MSNKSKRYLQIIVKFSKIKNHSHIESDFLRILNILNLLVV